MDLPNPTRRRLLASGGSGLAIGLAGCLGGRDDTAAQDEDDPEGETTGAGNERGGDHEHGSHNHDHDTDHEIGQPVSEITVEMITNDEGKHFIPHVVHVEPGGTVEWVLKRGAHDTTAYHPDVYNGQQRIPDEAEPWASDHLSDEGATFERTFDIEGIYDYVRAPHERDGMVGTVVVGWPDPEGQPGLETPADDRPDAAVEGLERYNEQVRAVLEAGPDGQSSTEAGHDHDHGHSDGSDHEH
ncbi:plastocyanin/azurin family copper-binding protein [Natrinema versiforme]|uniref:Blue (Type 1) copper domain-containing protein n=1 Tax=Natrinema versiforme JCM 10478 TaxID=1227496 RepID=L9YDW5_9EURY|nr:plastocyanin/azurin family copper-binding protein [Natrinema versiforme]ELY71083.1 blue (type 1) copper domain-containing protein [Natrinema versiforme JCM 10478]